MFKSTRTRGLAVVLLIVLALAALSAFFRPHIAEWWTWILQINSHLHLIAGNHGTLIYAVIALIIFCEVGLVVAPFLPGDSMLFAIGALCAAGVMDLTMVLSLFPVAAVAGDNFNRLLGVSFGHKVFRGQDGMLFNRKNLERTRNFFEKHGTRAVALCRFIPFFRTFVPFVAGMAGMRWRTFFPYSVLGGVGWVALCVLAGYLCGNLQLIRKSPELILMPVIAAAAWPAVTRYLKNRRQKKACPETTG